VAVWIDPTLSFDANRVLTAILANRRVFKVGENHEDYSGMGTTVAVGLSVDNRFVFSGVGDNRIYTSRMTNWCSSPRMTRGWR
jgi:serine/threonine protein phosphatase PrpC